MIVHRKTANDLMREKKERKLSGTKPRPLCATYVVTKNGDCIDTDQLTEMQILSIASQAINLSAEAYKECRTLKDNWLLDATYLMKLVEPHYEPTWEGMKVMIPLLKHHDIVVQNYARDVLLPTAVRGHYYEIEAIARFCKESRGNFAPVAAYDMLPIVNQMQINEERRAAEQRREAEERRAMIQSRNQSENLMGR